MPIRRTNLSSPSRASRPPAGRRAFSLMEVMMSVGVLALAITTSITAMQRALLSLDSARNIETACRILQTELEKERLLTWTQVSASSYQPAIDSVFLGNPAVAGRFSISRATSLVPNRGGKLLQITVTVSWRNYDGRAQERSQTTYYGNGGLFSYFTTQT